MLVSMLSCSSRHLSLPGWTAPQYGRDTERESKILVHAKRRMAIGSAISLSLSILLSLGLFFSLSKVWRECKGGGTIWSSQYESSSQPRPHLHQSKYFYLSLHNIISLVYLCDIEQRMGELHYILLHLRHNSP